MEAQNQQSPTRIGGDRMTQLISSINNNKNKTSTLHLVLLFRWEKQKCWEISEKKQQPNVKKKKEKQKDEKRLHGHKSDGIVCIGWQVRFQNVRVCVRHRKQTHTATISTQVGRHLRRRLFPPGNVIYGGTLSTCVFVCVRRQRFPFPLPFSCLQHAASTRRHLFWSLFPKFLSPQLIYHGMLSIFWFWICLLTSIFL